MRAALLIHGFATDKEDFKKLVPLLQTRYDEVLCENLPNHGEGTHKQKISLEQILEHVLSAFDSLKSRHARVDVIGFSMGGALATMLASLRNVSRLVLLAPANKYLAPYFVNNTIKRVRDSGWIKKRKKKPVEQGNITLKELIYDVADSTKMFFQLLPKYTLRNMREFRRIIDHCNRHTRCIEVPTLILWGRLDQLVPEGSVRQVQSLCNCQQTRVIIYPDVSHLMLHSRAHFRITDDILRFLEQTEPPLLEYKWHAVVSGIICIKDITD